MNVESNFMGRDTFSWFQGVVEDRRDITKTGRVKVRVLGWHTEDKKLIPTCKLLHMQVLMPVIYPQMTGLGRSPTGLVEGSWVFGFFRDGEAGQDGVIIGSMGGIPEEAAQVCKGFYDPGPPFHEVTAPRKFKIRYYPNNGQGPTLVRETKPQLYPREKHPWDNVLLEPDTNRLARFEKMDDTIIGVRKRQRDVNIPIGFAHPTPQLQWCEPEPTSNSRYPYNHVTETESGHITEFDDTPFNERFHLWHNSGTYAEIYNDEKNNKRGELQIRVCGNIRIVGMQKANVHIQNCANITIDGDVNLRCRSDVNMQVDGNMTQKIGGNFHQIVKGNHTVEVGGNIDLEATRIDLNKGVANIPAFPPSKNMHETMFEVGPEPVLEEKIEGPFDGCDEDC